MENLELIIFVLTFASFTHSSFSFIISHHGVVVGLDPWVGLRKPMMTV